MRSVRISLACSSVVLLAACSAFQAGSRLEEAHMTPAPANTYAATLASEYEGYADYEEEQMDWRDTVYFSERAIAAKNGNPPVPAEIGSRKLPEEHVGELTDARARLLQVLQETASESEPELAGRTVAAFDCWMEQQEENHQPEDIAACREQVMAGIEQLEAGMAPEPMPETIDIDGDVLFDFDKAAIRPEGEPILDDIAQRLVENTNARVLVWGHTDSTGPESYNQDLSVRRAESVANYLENEGVDRSRMTVEGFGESEPVATNDTAAGRQQNRRVEIRSR